MSGEAIQYLKIDDSWRDRLVPGWSAKVVRHLHFADGFTVLAISGERSIGLISVYWRELPPPLDSTLEGYIDIVEVHPAYRRRGIASRLIDISLQRAQEHGAFQVRAWSSEDKVEAIAMWKRLGFCLCPAVTFPGGQEVRGYFVTMKLASII